MKILNFFVAAIVALIIFFVCPLRAIGQTKTKDTTTEVFPAPNFSAELVIGTSKFRAPVPTPIVWNIDFVAQYGNWRASFQDTRYDADVLIGDRVFFKRECVTRPDGSIYCQEIFKDTSYQNKVVLGSWNLSLVCLKPVWKTRDLALLLGAGLEIHGERSFNIVYPSNQGTILIGVNTPGGFQSGGTIEKTTILSPSFVTVMRLRKTYSVKPWDVNFGFYAQANVQARGGELIFPVNTRTEISYNLGKKIFAGLLVSSSGETSQMYPFLGCRVFGNYTVSVYTNIEGVNGLLVPNRHYARRVLAISVGKVF